LFRNILANMEMGFNDNHFENITYLDDICDVIQDNAYNQFTISEYQFSDYIKSESIPIEREVIIHGNIKLGECQFDYIAGDKIRKNLTHGNMTYEFDFTNEVNSNGSQTPSVFQSKVHGKWLVSSDTFGFEDSFGYYMLENFSSLTSYDYSKSETDVITSELRSNVYIRDAYNNWDHFYNVHLNDGVIKKHLGSNNPYSGRLELTTRHFANSLIIEFSEHTVDIYINGDRVYENLSWTDLRATSLDI
ncbi:MAG: hypothetical protein HRU38_19015, partial [Saccharospirillaceae bacterium]|nr:hypothetical protein [Saccharospirillaceae bacterium]